MNESSRTLDGSSRIAPAPEEKVPEKKEARSLSAPGVRMVFALF